MWLRFRSSLATAWYSSAIPVAGGTVREVSSAHETGADRQPGAEPDRGALLLGGGQPGGREDPVLHAAAPSDREGSEGWGDEEGRCGARPRSRAGPGGRRKGGEHARGHRGFEGGRGAGL